MGTIGGGVGFCVNARSRNTPDSRYQAARGNAAQDALCPIQRVRNSARFRGLRSAYMAKSNADHRYHAPRGNAVPDALRPLRMLSD